jgi:hypothetical protein
VGSRWRRPCSASRRDAVGGLAVLRTQSAAGEFAAAYFELGAVGVEALQALAGRRAADFVDGCLHSTLALEHRFARGEGRTNSDQTVVVGVYISSYGATVAHILT